MLIPRYSVRWLLSLMTFCAGVSLVLSFAIRGTPWAIGVAAGLWSLVVVALAYVAAFLAAWLFSQAISLIRRDATASAGVSPFAATKELPLRDMGSAGTQPMADTPPPITG